MFDIRTIVIKWIKENYPKINTSYESMSDAIYVHHGIINRMLIGFLKDSSEIHVFAGRHLKILHPESLSFFDELKVCLDKRMEYLFKVPWKKEK